jgi:hypothetical protein
MTGVIMADRTKPVSIRLTGAEIDQLQARAYAVSATVTGLPATGSAVAWPAATTDRSRIA